jgi:hypothetical protein
VYKFDRLHAVKIGVTEKHKSGAVVERPFQAAVEREPVRAIPQRLGANAVIETLGRLGFDLKIHAATADTEDNNRFGQQTVADHAIPVADLDKALSETGIAFSERLRFKFACNRLGLIR